MKILSGGVGWQQESENSGKINLEPFNHATWEVKEASRLGILKQRGNLIYSKLFFSDSFDFCKGIN